MVFHVPAATQAGASKVTLQVTHGKKDAGIVPSQILRKVRIHVEPALQIKLLSSALL